MSFPIRILPWLPISPQDKIQTPFHDLVPLSLLSSHIILLLTLNEGTAFATPYLVHTLLVPLPCSSLIRITLLSLHVLFGEFIIISYRDLPYWPLQTLSIFQLSAPYCLFSNEFSFLVTKWLLRLLDIPAHIKSSREEHVFAPRSPSKTHIVCAQTLSCVLLFVIP